MRVSIVAVSVLAYSQSSNHSGAKPVENSDDPVRKQIWSFQVQNELKVFLWRASQDSLAVGTNIHRRIA